MSHASIFALALTLSIAGAIPAEATDYYVSSTGHDNNAGTSTAQAWRTLQRVNNHQFAAGDRIFLEGGKTFSGNLYFDSLDAGRPDAPITVGSYGTGWATVYAANGTGMLFYNTAGFTVENLYVIGSGRDTNVGQGIFFYNDLPGDVKLDHIRIQNVATARFGEYGILIGSNSGRSGFRKVHLQSVVAAENRMGGIFTYAAQPNVHESVYVGYARAYLNSGMAGLLFNSGNGIALSGVSGGTIERSVAYENGWLSDAGNGPIGIWAFDSTNILVQFNESHHNRTGGEKDGGGFCFDQNTSYSVMQFNYSHDNAGAGYLLAHRPDNYEHTNNIVRFNISENDARANAYAGIHTWGRIRNAQIHNNTVYLADRGSATEVPRGILVKNSSITLQDPENLYFRNNIIQTTGGVRLVEVQASALDGAVNLRFEGNSYFSTGGAFSIVWGGTVYSTLADWRAATGQERIGGVNTGLSVDPRLTAPGQGITVGDADLLATLSGYRLRSDSPLIEAGLDLRTMGVAIGTRDYFGGPVPSGTTLDIGAHEFGGECRWTVSPTTATAAAAGGSGSVDVTTSTTPCSWAAHSSVSWITVTAGQSGTASARVTYSVAANTASTERTGTLRVANVDVTIKQAAATVTPPTVGGPSIHLGLGPYSGSGGWFATHEGAAGSFASRGWGRLPWDGYNASGGGLRLATGDVDGDGADEIIVALGPAGAGWVAVLDDAARGYALLSWIRVGWEAYISRNGEVFPAVGDLDGDGRAEIVLGLGDSGGGWYQIFDDASKQFQPIAWRQVPWAAYNAGTGRTHPAVGDLDGDGKAEIVIGLGAGSDGFLQVVSDAAAGFSHRAWVRIQWDAYAKQRGTTFPAVGDLDGDGRAEIVAGLGTGGEGWFAIIDDAPSGFAHVSWQRVSWAAYNAANGETHPAIGNIDGDAALEIVLGLGEYSGNGGWFEVRDDALKGNVHVAWRNVGWAAFTAAGGALFPAIAR